MTMDNKFSSTKNKNLLIVGPGNLGSYLGKICIDDGFKVSGFTMTTNNHDRLNKLGIIPYSRDELKPMSSEKYDYVVFCAPRPKLEHINESLEYWNKLGSYVFTSATSVYSRDENDIINENAKTIIVGNNERVDIQLIAEEAVLNAGGNVLRLGGLYHSMRGAHSAIIKKGETTLPRHKSLNLIHYEDAASLTYQILLNNEKFRNEIFLGIDDKPVTIEEIIIAAMNSGLFPGDVKYLNDEKDTVNIEFENKITREKTGWNPKYDFINLMKSNGQDWYMTSGFWDF